MQVAEPRLVGLSPSASVLRHGLSGEPDGFRVRLLALLVSAVDGSADEEDDRGDDDQHDGGDDPEISKDDSLVGTDAREAHSFRHINITF